MVVFGVSTGALVVFALIGVALVLFVSEVIPNDVTAIGIVVALAALEPWTGVGARGAISGFANTATVTIVAMYMLSAGIGQTGLVQRLGIRLAGFARGSETRALAATIGTTGPIAGFINNTPVVAVFIPMITDLAKESGVSPSKLLLPLSYAAILGGTLTLIGTSTNLLASEFTATLLDRGPIGMFEFTGLGVVVLAVGLAYLMTVGRWLTPARIPADADLVEEFGLEEYLTTVRVPAGSPAVGLGLGELDDRTESPVTPLQLRRNGEAFLAVETDQRLQAGDVLVVNGAREAVNRFLKRQGLDRVPRGEVTEETFADAPSADRLGRAVVPETSAYVGETLSEARLATFHGMQVLAIRREGELIRTGLHEVELAAGDLLLVQTTPESTEYFADGDDLFVLDEDALDRLEASDSDGGKGVDAVPPLSPKTPVAVAIMGGVVGLAAFDVLPIVIAALGGVFAMIVTGCLSSADAYDAVSWNVIFLLAGVIPLGLAMEETGGAALIAETLVATATILPLVAVLLLFSVVTGLLANVITPVATIVLMIPVAVDAAARLDASGFSFLLVVTFASATSFMTPVGYQTNLMVYGPGGYRFTDFLRVGAPLQFLLAVVTTLGVVWIWGL
ncbi:di/tricarboxylate transporter [Halorubrum alkaliphilum]|uniref:Di/tricarboxylate transporter n=1 Tax=Halorubrum alkaliphilum TaxID=261290 RepID=A0A8T4GBI4_9EURY|nr:SLC13 family permease [Halorubrum alkaliphilum]MBP1921466.1 di/tricarboxylate transporter [Halorubrum alkaliphilum]